MRTTSDRTVHRCAAIAGLILLAGPALNLASVEVKAAPVPKGAAAATAAAAEPRARDFVAALAKGDPKLLAEFYAPTVVVIGGSELLKPKWGVVEDGDPKQDAEVSRDKLIAGYARIIAKAGDRWAQAWKGVVEDQKKVTVTKATVADAPFKGVRAGDYILKIVPGQSDDWIGFILREDKDKRWVVVIEGADY
jgi:hypothetical protein